MIQHYPGEEQQEYVFENYNCFNMKNCFFTIRYIQIIFYSCIILTSVAQNSKHLNTSNYTDPIEVKQKATLDFLLKILPPDRIHNGRVSYLDETFKDWLNRTGELPPDFDNMPSIPFLPDPLILDEGGKNIPVTTMEQWQEKRKWMKEQLMKYITGTVPPAPDNLKAKVISESMDGKVTLKLIELSFGPNHEAKLTIELMIPPGEGSFPVFITQWYHREWAQVAVRRGYVGCIYAGSDGDDDTEKYSEIWAGEYDFTRLMRRAWGASRAIDYLYTLPQVDKEKIALTGHSRNGKTTLMAAAFDERITACIPSSGGTGAEVPWRYTSQNYDIEDIALLACAQPAWLHPRLRFFTGREHKLPVDQNSFMALIAPRGLMLSTAISEGASNPWGIEQAFQASKKIYQFLGNEKNLAIRSRYGLHSVCARDMEDYIDFFDFVFKRSSYKPENKLFYDYSFDEWLEISDEKLDLKKFSEHYDNELISFNDSKDIVKWEEKKLNIKKQIQWALGDEPPGVTNYGPGSLRRSGNGEVSFGTFLTRPQATNKMGRMNISPYNGFGDQLFGYLYYPLNENGELKHKNMPVIIYLHEYDYSKGFNSYHQIENILQTLTNEGFAVFTFDMIGFGNRIEEGTRFYERYPEWSKMGKMVTDVKGAVDALENFDFINSSQIVVLGYSLGANVGLYSAAMDERIAGIISIAGFTPMRTNTLEKGTEGIMAYSHLHGLMPRLGFFVGNESRIPYDYHELLATLAPRSVLIIAPEYDKDAHIQDIKQCIKQTSTINSIYNFENNIQLLIPNDINRFSKEILNDVVEWLKIKFK